MNRKRLLEALIFLLLFLASLSYFPGHLLVVNQPPQKADVILVLAGDRGSRLERGVSLWQEGYAPSLMVSGGNIYYETNIGMLMKEHAVKLGVPEQAVLVEPYADSTYQNAVLTRELMMKYNLQSAIVVSSNYHMYRVRLLYEREFKGTGIHLSYCAAQDENFNQDRWWANNKSAMLTISEYIKLVGYAIGRNR